MSEAELKKLVAIRGACKSQLTRFQNHFEKINKDNADERTLIELEEKLSQIKLVRDQFNSVQLDIELTTEAEDDNERERFEDRYYNFTSSVKVFIKDLTQQPRTSVNSNSNAEAISVHSQNSQICGSVKLPTIELPKFNGNYEEWLHFRDMFKALVHENTLLSDVQRFQYLQRCMSGKAGDILNSLPVTHASYETGWKLLTDRFENIKLITQNHVAAIFEVAPLKKETHTALRQLSDTITKNLRAIKSLGQDTSNWDLMLIHIIVSKLDVSGRKHWAEFSSNIKSPTYKDITAFLAKRAEILEQISPHQSQNENLSQKHKHNYKVAAVACSNSQSEPSTALSRQYKCSYCGGSHQIYHCESFTKLTGDKKRESIIKLRLCFNCLKANHSVKECKSRWCRHCNKKHNSLLHNFDSGVQECMSADATIKSNRNTAEIANNSNTDDTRVSHLQDCSINRKSHVLLSTAIVTIRGPNNKLFKAKALLDSGAQASIIKQQLVQKIGLKTREHAASVTGINQSVTNVNKVTSFMIQNSRGSFEIPIECLVLPNITKRFPKIQIQKALDIPSNVELADPEFANGGEIEILIGGDIFWSVIGSKQIKLQNRKMILYDTKFGYILAGTLYDTYSENVIFVNTCTIEETNLHKQLEKFWNIEHLAEEVKTYTQTERICEKHFSDTHARDSTGRFIVKIPFNEKINQLGESKELAMRRFFSIERRLQSDTELKQKYTTFMNDYIKLGYMVEVNDAPTKNNSYYLAHHCVFKNNQERKIRIVFDGSMKTTSGFSLNDTQYIGPTIQRDLFSILIHFRQHKFVLVGDIEKMYSQVMVHEDDRKFQRMFWRDDITKPIKEFELTRVTFGQSASPFLAIRSLKQLAIEHRLSHPRVAEVIESCFYVDDLLCGSDCLEDLKIIKDDITKILKSGEFTLNKWHSNQMSLLDKKSELGSIQIGESAQNKTLGVYWNSVSDTFHYNIDTNTFPAGNTKRAILSIISRFFDPLGYLGPILIAGKIIIQTLWLHKCSWDEIIPAELQRLWIDYKEQFEFINNIEIPRRVLTSHAMTLEVHSFSDASEKAYGGVIYIRCIKFDGSISTEFLCAKSRVSPVKSVSLPRLELCGALLVSKLFCTIKKAMTLHITKAYFWTDSTITLHWIKNTNAQWKTFVANRVSIIQSITEPNEWYHVKSAENPADIISRGMSAQDILYSKLWRHGPSFLQNHESVWSQSSFNYEKIDPQEQKSVLINTVTSKFDDFNLFEKSSNLNTLVDVMSLVLRFIHNCRFRTNRKMNDLTPYELNHGLNALIKISQAQSFAKEIIALKQNGKVAKKSPLVTLCPFIDHIGLIRVGGRLRYSPYSFNKKHPILLDPKHILTELIVRQEHVRLLHCGAQTLLASIREKYWPVRGKNLIKRITRQCNTCFKFNPETVKYIMADLPTDRVCPQRAFNHCAADFAGPFQIKDKVTRGYKLIKMYVCIFVCYATKAVHLELVSDLSTDAFMSAFRRFTSRRGKCAKIHTDNGTNFVGACNEIKRVYEFFEKSQSEINTQLGREGMFWSFSPPRSPHFNGIAESGVRATKNHLKRIIGETHLSQEEFNTVLTQVEACLNSRPISALSDDPSDLNALTPGHFLVGGPLMALPEEDISTESINRLTRWQRVQQISQHFWQRWRTEYLHQLQQRFKWNHSTTPAPAIGDLVLIKDNNMTPLQWSLGRIAEHITGKDGTIRVVKVKTVKGLYERAITSVCPLPNIKREVSCVT